MICHDLQVYPRIQWVETLTFSLPEFFFHVCFLFKISNKAFKYKCIYYNYFIIIFSFFFLTIMKISESRYILKFGCSQFFLALSSLTKKFRNETCILLKKVICNASCKYVIPLRFGF